MDCRSSVSGAASVPLTVGLHRSGHGRCAAAVACSCLEEPQFLSRMAWWWWWSVAVVHWWCASSQVHAAAEAACHSLPQEGEESVLGQAVADMLEVLVEQKPQSNTCSRSFLWQQQQQQLGKVAGHQQQQQQGSQQGRHSHTDRAPSFLVFRFICCPHVGQGVSVAAALAWLGSDEWHLVMISVLRQTTLLVLPPSLLFVCQQEESMPFARVCEQMSLTCDHSPTRFVFCSRASSAPVAQASASSCSRGAPAAAPSGAEELLQEWQQLSSSPSSSTMSQIRRFAHHHH